MPLCSSVRIRSPASRADDTRYQLCISYAYSVSVRYKDIPTQSSSLSTDVSEHLDTQRPIPVTALRKSNGRYNLSRILPAYRSPNQSRDLTAILFDQGLTHLNF